MPSEQSEAGAEHDEDGGQCPLKELPEYELLTGEIRFCPFCGNEADDVTGAGVGRARCTKCDRGFWVEL